MRDGVLALHDGDGDPPEGERAHVVVLARDEGVGVVDESGRGGGADAVAQRQGQALVGHPGEELRVRQERGHGEPVEDLHDRRDARILELREPCQLLHAAARHGEGNVLARPGEGAARHLRRHRVVECGEGLAREGERPVVAAPGRLERHANRVELRLLDRRPDPVQQRVGERAGLLELPGEVRAFGVTQVHGEPERVAGALRVLGEERDAEPKVLERVPVGRGLARALARFEIELGELDALVAIGDAGDAAVELIDDVEDLLPARRRFGLSQQDPPEPEVELRALALRDAAVGRLADAIVEELVVVVDRSGRAAFRHVDESEGVVGLERDQEPIANRRRDARPRLGEPRAHRRREQLQIEAVAGARADPERLARRGRQVVDLSHQQNRPRSP